MRAVAAASTSIQLAVDEEGGHDREDHDKDGEEKVHEVQLHTEFNQKTIVDEMHEATRYQTDCPDHKSKEEEKPQKAKKIVKIESAGSIEKLETVGKVEKTGKSEDQTDSAAVHTPKSKKKTPFMAAVASVKAAASKRVR